MKIRASIATVAAAALLAGGTALALPAAASTSNGTHTLKFISVTKKTVDFAKTNSGQQDTDVNSKGKVVGFDTLNISATPGTHKGSILVTIDAKGGFLIAVLPISRGKILPGIVTGGVGSYKDAFGSITTKKLNKAGTRTSFTIKYTT